MKTTVTVATNGPVYVGYTTLKGTWMVITPAGRKVRANATIASMLTAQATQDVLAAAFSATETAETETETAETETAETATLAKSATRSMRSMCGQIGLTHRGSTHKERVTTEDILVGAFLYASANCGLENLCDSNEAIEVGTSYQKLELGLFRGRGKKAEALATVKIPATRGKIHVPMWIRSLQVSAGVKLEDTDVSPKAYPLAYVPAKSEVGAYLITTGDGEDKRILHALKCSRDGKAVPQRLGLKQFLTKWVEPICAATMSAATGLELGGLTYSIHPVMHGEIVWS